MLPQGTQTVGHFRMVVLQQPVESGLVSDEVCCFVAQILRHFDLNWHIAPAAVRGARACRYSHLTRWLIGLNWYTD